MLCRALLVALCTTATSAMADPAADYSRLQELIPALTFQRGPGDQLTENTALISQLQGRWIALSLLMGDDRAMPAAETIATACERTPIELAPAGLATLTATQLWRDGAAVARLQYAGGMTYIASYDEAGQIKRLFGAKPVEELDPNMLHSTLTANLWLGYLTLLPVGDSLLLVQPLAEAPLLLMRCPA